MRASMAPVLVLGSGVAAGEAPPKEFILNIFEDAKLEAEDWQASGSTVTGLTRTAGAPKPKPRP